MINLLKIGDEQIDKVVERVLTDDRVEKIARRVAEMLLTQLLEGLQGTDKKDA